MKQKNNYDEEPIYYCHRCLSLAIKSDIDDFCYCNECGSTHIENSTVFQWESLYTNRYGIEFIKQRNKLNSNKNGRE